MKTQNKRIPFIQYLRVDERWNYFHLFLRAVIYICQFVLSQRILCDNDFIKSRIVCVNILSYIIMEIFSFLNHDKLYIYSYIFRDIIFKL